MNSIRVRRSAAPCFRLMSTIALQLISLHPSRADDLSFTRDIRPILSDKCYFCHGPDAAQREADLRLDESASAERAWTPGRPEESPGWLRILADDPAERMPPPESGLTLNEEEKQRLKDWISAGARYEAHWAFEPPPRELTPPLVRHDWVQSAGDCWIAESHSKQLLQPAPAAAPLRWLRRLTFDLTGLPPSLFDQDEFLAATDANDPLVRQRTVDRLLASPAFGEHWAVPWLDAARYADSYGYQSDQLNTQWPYRDWVVRAFNDKAPIDQFLTEQLAGDLLPEANRDQRLATAFNRMHRMTNEGGSIPLEWQVENTADRLQTFGAAMLGLTLECARCHDHKYDPISARDYYALFAYFNSIDEHGLYDHAAKTPPPSVLLPTPEQQAALLGARKHAIALEERLSDRRNEIREDLALWLAAAPASPPLADLSHLFRFEPIGRDGETRIVNELSPDADTVKVDPALLVPGRVGAAVRFDGDQSLALPTIPKLDRWTPFTVDFWLNLEEAAPGPAVVLHQTYGTDAGYNGFDVMLEADDRLSVRLYRSWPGNGVGIRTTSPIDRTGWRHLCVRYDGASRAAGLTLFESGAQAVVEVVRDRIWKRSGLPTYGSGQFQLGGRFRDRGLAGGKLDELRFIPRAISDLEAAALHDPAVWERLRHPQAASSAAVADYYVSAIDDTARSMQAQLNAARKAAIEWEEAQLEVSTMEEAAEVRPAHLLARGAYDAPRSSENEVARATPAAISPDFENVPDRRALASWMVHPQHPLTSRVFVNRVWMQFFGRGLVSTPDNFGLQGAAPDHPQLLDFLSRDLMNHGWDLNQLCREIALSATYAQDSRTSPEQRNADPENRWLARGPARRLTAEQLRDLALAASGLLDEVLGGPPVSPYQAGGDLWREANTMSPEYVQSTGAALYRRSLYSVRKRTAPLPNVLAFDAPSREVCQIARIPTNTPLQALVLWNDVQFVEAARRLAEHISLATTSSEEQFELAWRRLCSEDMPADARLVLREFYEQQLQDFSTQDGLGRAVALLSQGDSPRLSAGRDAELAALTRVCQLILNHDSSVWNR